MIAWDGRKVLFWVEGVVTALDGFITQQRQLFC